MAFGEWGDPETVEVMRFIHRVEHLRWRKGLGVLPEGGWVAECWMPYTAPEWAVHLAESGAPGTRWCPAITPELLSKCEDC